MKIFIMNRYISKSYTTTKNAIDRAGTALVSTITSNILYDPGNSRHFPRTVTFLSRFLREDITKITISEEF